MNVLKKDWKPDLGLRHVLVVVRCLLVEPFAESALNEEAGRLLLEDYGAFAARARLMTGVHASSGPSAAAARARAEAAAAGGGAGAGGRPARGPHLGLGGRCRRVVWRRARRRAAEACRPRRGRRGGRTRASCCCCGCRCRCPGGSRGRLREGRGDWKEREFRVGGRG